MRLYEFTTRMIPWIRNPQIGWWLENDPVTFYHGTHQDNLEGILKGGIYAPRSGPTAGWVSLALEPNTAFGYASMKGGESKFRADAAQGFRGAGTTAQHVPANERIVFVLRIPHSYFKSKMAAQRGNVDHYRDKLTNQEAYTTWKSKGGQDQEYYAMAEIRIPEMVPANFIVGVTRK